MPNSRFAITAGLLVSSGKSFPKPLVVVEDGRIASVSSQQSQETPGGIPVLDFPNAVVAPGFVDIHVHGGAGRDVMQADEEALAGIERHLARTGVTSYFPTTVTASVAQTLDSLARLSAAIEGAKASSGWGRAQPLAIHLEGPFLSHAKCGVHPPEHLQDPSITLFEQMWEVAQGRVGMLTIAPELPGALEVIEHAATRNVCVSLGHSNSELEPARAALRRGARHATHTFNAMRPLDHRDPGILGFVLAEAELTADIIADGIHVHPEIVRLFLRAKGPRGAVLITDAISATGMGDGRYQLGPIEVEVQGERCLYQGKLAGSVLTMDRALANTMEFSGWSLEDAVGLATMNPARVAGIAMRPEGGGLVPWKGALEPGADADIVVLAEGKVLKTFARGVDSCTG